MRRASLVLALLVVALGVTGLVGWATDNATLKSVRPGYSEMKANTALCFMLTGTALALRGSASGRYARFVGAVLTLVAAGIGLLTLSEYSFRVDLGIDQLLFWDRGVAPGTTSPGRMGANTALTFVIGGMSILLLDGQWHDVRPAQVGALMNGAIAYLVLLGYMYDVSNLERSFVTAAITPMAVHTAFGVCLLAAGIVLARPAVGFMNLVTGAGPGGMLVRRLLPLALVAPPLIGGVRLDAQKSGLFGVEQGVAIYTTALVMLMVTIVWLTARALEAEGQRAEIQRTKLEAQLRQAQKLEAIGRLAGGIAHDFNNILTVILGNSELLLARLRSDDPARVDANDILGAAERGSSLVRQLLAFSRRQVLVPRILNLNEVVVELEPLLRRLIGDSIELRTRLDSELVRVCADPSQMQQVILNLVVNGRDAMPNGGNLIVETRNVACAESETPEALAPGVYARISVTDTGAGIDADVRERLFEPFFTTKGAEGGTGLGLATIYGIVAQSGGAIVVDSEPGHGATFEVYLPAAKPQNDPSTFSASRHPR